MAILPPCVVMVCGTAVISGSVTESRISSVAGSTETIWEFAVRERSFKPGYISSAVLPWMSQPLGRTWVFTMSVPSGATVTCL
ncbi:hypothetical protein [Streptomyces sp. NPDC029003]|uniref:hypothetical protein n=1 Tax=Streptomyces sp. NPDC029003 TaxID=3155125 RepID=UPI0033F74F55